MATRAKRLVPQHLLDQLQTTQRDAERARRTAEALVPVLARGATALLAIGGCIATLRAKLQRMRSAF